MQAVHDKCRSSAADGAGIQKARHCRDIVPIKNRGVVQRIAIERSHVEVIAGIRVDLRVVVGDRDLLPKIRDRQLQFDWPWRSITNRNASGG